MKAQIKREGSIRELAHLTVHIKDVRYRISETNEGEMEILKIDIDDGFLEVRPKSSNVITIK